MTASPQSITADYEFAQPPHKVWRALTDSSLMATWLMPNDFRPVVGHRFTFRAQPMPHWDGIVNCEVLEVDEPRRLRYSWRGGAGEFALDTTVTWTLTPSVSGGTRLHLDHAGFLPTNAFALQGMEKGWRGHIAERLAQAVAEV
jgi:uncharacterized protein YndB with AHSA1/START domain